MQAAIESTTPTKPVYGEVTPEYPLGRQPIDETFLDVPLLIAAGFEENSFGTNREFMRRDLEEVGNLTLHAKAFIDIDSAGKITAWQGINVYQAKGMVHLSEYKTNERKRQFKSTEEALSALGYDADRFRQSV